MFQETAASPCPQTQKVNLDSAWPSLPRTESSIRITWELVRNAESQAPSQTYGPRIFILKNIYLFIYLAMWGLGCSRQAP